MEFKHQNISAVLAELGLPWIPGYRPMANYQNALIDAIDRHLTNCPGIFQTVSPAPMTVTPLDAVFVDAPVAAADQEPISDRLFRLVRKLDPAERDYRNRTLGKAGESFVMDLERRKLAQVNRPDLLRKVRWIADEDGDGAGYDVLSFDHLGVERLIEVKTRNGPARTPFFLSRNERELAAERPSEWRIYRVHLFTQGPRVFTLAPPLEMAVNLRPATWRATF